MKLTLKFKARRTREYIQSNWEEILTILYFFKHYSEHPCEVKIENGEEATYVFEVVSPVHYNTVIMMIEEVFSKS